LAGQREVQRQAVGQLACGEQAAQEERQPQCTDDATVVHDESGETLHVELLVEGWIMQAGSAIP
jgi:hypothetical protein